jgi:hypothetical protein
MAKVGATLTDSIDKQSLHIASLEKLSDALATDSEPLSTAMDEDSGKAAPAIDASETTTDNRPSGVNKATVSKSSRGKKYSLRKAMGKKPEEKPRPEKKYRYHCAF